MPVIDFHNHFYPAEYLDALRAGESVVKLTIDAEGNPCVHYPGDYNVAVRGHRDIDYRQSVLARYTFARLSDSIAALYRELLAQRRRR